MLERFIFLKVQFILKRLCNDSKKLYFLKRGNYLKTLETTQKLGQIS